MHSYIISAVRTPIGKFLGALSSLTAPQLASIAIRDCLRRAGSLHDNSLAGERGQTFSEPIASMSTIPPIDEVILGNVLQAGVGQAPARQAALAAGLPPGIAAVTINKVCGSGLKAVMLADQAIRCGDANLVIAGGMESMSRAPHLLLDSRTGRKFGPQTLADAMIHDGLYCPTERQGMGEIAERLAREHAISREQQDAFAAESHRRAIAAQVDGRFAAEIVPVPIESRGASTLIDRDESPRGNTTSDSLSKLPPAFAASGTVTAGNSSQISDGAAAVLVVNERIAKESNSPLKARIVASAVHGEPPGDLFIAPVGAIRRVLERAQLALRDIDVIELNEAFAVQCLACMTPLELDPARVNVNGGAIALGHPIGASGARVLVTLLHTLAQRNLRRGLASLCLGGGNAVAMIVEREPT